MYISLVACNNNRAFIVYVCAEWRRTDKSSFVWFKIQGEIKCLIWPRLEYFNFNLIELIGLGYVNEREKVIYYAS